MTTYRRADYPAAEPTTGEWLFLLGMLLAVAIGLGIGIYAVFRLVTGR